MTAIAASNAEAARLFRQWSMAAHRTAVTRRASGDEFGTLLATARAGVYALAAELATGLPPDRLAAECTRGEIAHSFGNPDGSALRDTDRLALEHVRAMAWQLCARTVEPGHEPVEQPW